MSKAGAFLFASVLLGACGVGDPGDTTPDPADPNPNGLRCSAGLRTTGTFTESTTNPRPNDPLGPDGEAGTADDNTTKLGGCWPVGTWTFTAAIDDTVQVVDVNGDGAGDRCGEVSGTSPPTLESSYSFKVDRVDDPDSDGLLETYTYLGSSANFFAVKISEGGGGDCEGIMEFKSPDDKQWWTLNPNICTSANCSPASGAITGGGDFTDYLEAQPY
ncbi:MAG: hypothetical protein H0V17_13760 [Deltaproteobacteria bacterium]|nr:hypothetical protein [Deltaproteobacteria bacterium]